MKIVPIIICSLFLVSGCTTPLFYRPSCDLDPVLTIRLPDHINTLAGCPRDETQVENGFNKLLGERVANDIKERFNLQKGDCDYRFTLFFSDDDAMRWYESDKFFTSKRVPKFKEATKNGCSGCLYYTEQLKSDQGLAPSGVYFSYVIFRLRNAFVSIYIQDDRPRSDKLTIAVNDLAQMLNGTLVNHDGNH